jgi:RNA polymerase sigma-70 factor (ECF subfamily)
MPTSDTRFQRLLDDNQGRLERLARQYADPADWQDLLQEIHVQLWLSLDSFDGRAQLSTWVYRVALNTAISHRRKRRLPQAGGAPDDLGDNGATHDSLDVLREFLASLGSIDRALLLMDLEDMTREQIAEVLGLSIGAIAVRMTRLKQQFSQRYLEP